MSNDRITKVHGRLSKEVLCGWRYSFVLGSSVWCKPTRSLCIFSSLSQLLLSSPSSQTWMSPKVLPFALSFSHWRLLHHLSSITGHEDHCCSYCVLPCHTLQFDITSSLSLDFSTRIFHTYFKFYMIEIEIIVYPLTRPSVCFCSNSVNRTSIRPAIPAKSLCLCQILPSLPSPASVEEKGLTNPTKSSSRLSCHYFLLYIPTITSFESL